MATWKTLFEDMKPLFDRVDGAVAEQDGLWSVRSDSSEQC